MEVAALSTEAVSRTAAKKVSIGRVVSAMNVVLVVSIKTPVLGTAEKDTTE